MRDPDRDEIARTMLGDYAKMSLNPWSLDYKQNTAAKAKAQAKKKAKTDAYADVE